MSEFLEAALQYAEEGLSVFPVKPRGKTPLITDNLNRATTDPDQIREWWERWPDANIGLVAGKGLAVLDVDIKSGGEDTLNRLAQEHGAKNTKIVKTGGGGFHFYFRDDPDEPLPQSAGKIGPGLDIRAGGKGYVVAPPSVHPSGNRYTLHNGAMMGEVWPWLRDLAFESASSPTEAVPGPSEKIPSGQRNNTLASLAGRLQRQGLDKSAITAALLIENQKRCDPPLSDDEVEKIAASVARYAPAEDYAETVDPTEVFEADPEAKPAPPPGAQKTDRFINLTDEAIVYKAMVPNLEDELRYINSFGKWLVWEGHKWELDNELVSERRIRDRLRRVAIWLDERGRAAPDEKQGEPYMKAARKYQNSHGITSILKLVRAPLGAAADDFDKHPDLLNTPAGVVDLRTGEIGPTEPGHLFMKSTDVAPAEGPAPQWARFLIDLTGGDKHLIKYIHRFGGYCLTGHMYEKILWNIWGSDSDTGKSTFLKVLSGIWGDYAQTVDIKVFVDKNRDNASSLAQLVGARLVTATEPSSGHTWDDKVIKSITGGDEIQARFLYANPFTYQPRFKIMVAGNHEPKLDTVDDAMLRRLRIVPFNRKVPKEKQIEQLDEKLIEEEGPQILRWFIEGARAWYEEGLDTPPAVKARTDEYTENVDIVGQWLKECCETGNFDDHRAVRQDLYESWQTWCRRRGENPGTYRDFKGLLEGRRDLTIRDALVGEERRQGFWGISLKQEAFSWE